MDFVLKLSLTDMLNIIAFLVFLTLAIFLFLKKETPNHADNPKEEKKQEIEKPEEPKFSFPAKSEPSAEAIDERTMGMQK